MESFAFHTPTRLVFGPGVLDHLPGMLLDLKIRRPLLVTDQGLVQSGLAERVLALMPHETTAVFSETPSNPTDTAVHKALEQAREHQADGVVALGGGSPIDLAKAVAVLMTNEGSLHDYLGMDLVRRPGLPFVAIPTTAGSGSEVTLWAVITDTRGETPLKDAIGSHLVCPTVTLADPELTLDLPPRLTAWTGLDALTHAIEAYWARCANPISDALALDAVARISAHLPQAVFHGGIEHRTPMLLASIQAGMAFSNADVGAVHSLGETLGGAFNLHHGLTMGLLLPYVLEANLPACPERIARLAPAMGRPGVDQGLSVLDAARETLDAVCDLVRLLELPSLAELGVSADSFPTMAALAVEHPCMIDNPRRFTAEELERLLEQVLDDELGLHEN